jgi:uncharacterized protein (TIGR03435 family)
MVFTMKKRVACNLRRLLSLSMVLSAAIVVAQTNTVPVPTPDAKLITFEVVSIRPHAPGTMSYGPGFTDDGWTVHGVGLFSLFYSNFGGLKTEGVPNWGSDSYDIQAKVAEADIPAWKLLKFPQRNLAVQALLADRFKLKWHRETRPMPGYALVVAKGGPKFREATRGDTYVKGFKALDGAPLTGVMMGTSRGVFSGQAISMQKVADFLGGFAGRPVLDKTGLTGTYDLTLQFDPLPPSPPPSAAGEAAAPEPSGPSIFTVVQEQLGLKLESGTTVPVEFLVVDHMERPTAN